MSLCSCLCPCCFSLLHTLSITRLLHSYLNRLPQGRENGLIIFDRERHNIQHAMSLAKVSPVFHPYFCSLADAGRDLFYARYHPIERVNIYTDAVLFGTPATS